MGLSLKKLGATIGSILHGAERDINIFDNGASHGNPRVGAPPAQPINQQIGHAITSAPNMVGNFIGNGIYNQAHNISNSVLGGEARIGLANLTNNPQANINAHLALTQANKDVNNTLQDPHTYVNLIGESGVGKTPKGTPPPRPKVTPKNIPTEVKPVIAPAGKGTLTPPDFLKTSPEYAAKHPQAQTEAPVTKPLPTRPNIPRTDNPIKVELSNPKASEYGAAIADKQRAESNIGQAAARAQYSIKKLSGNDQQLFAHARENPKLIKNAENPKQLKEAITRYGTMTDTAHAFDVAAGGKTPHIANYYRHEIDLSKPEDAARFDALAQKKGTTTDPFSYHGLNNQPRVFKTIKEAEGAGFKVLNKDPLKEVQDYANRAKGVVGNQALARGAQLADAARGPEAALTKKFELGPGRYVDVSPEANKALRGTQQLELSKNPVVRGLRTANVGLKTTILSGGQFHPFNISVMRAGPALAMKGHPVRGVKGIGKTFRPLLPGGKAAHDRMMLKAATDTVIDPGTGKAVSYVDAAATIGTPYGQAGYNVAGSALKHGVGHKLVFERQMPGMHDEVVRSVINDLVKKNIPLASEEARQTGVVANSTMGFINQEALNMPPRVRQSMTDFMLAGQFTPSKVVTLLKAGKGGLAGSYARADVAANVAGATAIIAGVGYLVNQKSDSVRDMLLRALVNPAVPTPYKDKKGNTQELRIPLTYTSELAHILGIKLTRQKDGHLGVNWNPQNIPGTAGEWARARLSPVASTAVKLKTNTNFANKPLYDPNAPAGTKAIQAATTVGQGFLPIGAQGLAYTDFAKKHLPGSSRDVLGAGTPGSNPVLKSGLSSVGFSPRTDQTVGKSLDSSRYFSALDNAKKGLNGHEAAVLELYAGNKKNPVTGKYEVAPNVNDSSSKAKALLDQPKVIDKLIGMNAKLKSQGQSVDPLWTASKDQITKVLQYQAMPPGGADKAHWIARNGSWYQPLSDQRSTFFNGSPKGDPNKPSAPIEYPSPAPDVAANQKAFFSLTDSAQRAKFLTAHPEVQTQLDKQVDYNNQLRQAQGYSALDTFPKAAPGVQKVIDTYNSLPKNDGPKGGSKTRSLWIQAHPKEYAAMTQYFTQASLYSLQKETGQSQFKDTGLSQKGLKDLYSLGQYDVQKTTDTNGNTFYALGGSSGSSSGSGNPSKYSSSKRYSSNRLRYAGREGYTKSAFRYAVSINAGGKGAKPKIKAKKASAPKKVSIKGPAKSLTSKPKVTISKSKV